MYTFAFVKELRFLFQYIYLIIIYINKNAIQYLLWACIAFTYYHIAQKFDEFWIQALSLELYTSLMLSFAYFLVLGGRFPSNL